MVTNLLFYVVPDLDLAARGAAMNWAHEPNAAAMRGNRKLRAASPVECQDMQPQVFRKP